MKKTLFTFAVLFLSFSVCSAAPRSLVVYFSWSNAGNTRNLAKMIAAETKADIEELLPIKPYPVKYQEVLRQGRRELEKNIAVPVRKLKKDWRNYDIIFVGSPIWFATYAPPVRTFLQKNDLKGKKVLFFCTHGRGGPGKFFKEAAALVPHAKTGKNFNCYAAHMKKISPEVKKWAAEVIK
ncbi:MAG: NAD(P)H-dependent oxidoreductase [Lentisphaeria bacterium]|nr:NAD(P)H-dependent oxidoreductase [Lentisphaeria bacterium]